MIIWGSGSGVCIAGEAGMRDCPVCGSAQRFDLSVSYGYAHVWYLFSWVTRRKYLCVCARCHNGFALSKREFQERVAKDPIPLMRRRGWMFAPVIVGLFLLFGAVQSLRPTAAPDTPEADAVTQANYREAVTRAVRMNWLRPDDTPDSPCKVRVSQLPGGKVTSVDVEPDCPYDEVGRRAVVNAVRRTDPLPYQGYEKAFQPSLVITFSPLPEASAAAAP